MVAKKPLFPSACPPSKTLYALMKNKTAPAKATQLKYILTTPNLDFTVVTKKSTAILTSEAASETISLPLIMSHLPPLLLATPV